MKRAFILCATTILISSPHAFSQEGSWKGKAVFPKHDDVRIIHPKGLLQNFLGQYHYDVLDEKDALIMVIQHGNEVWVEKKEVVLEKDALGFFSSQLEKNPKDQVARARRASILDWAGRHEEAIKEWTVLIRDHPKVLAYFSNRSRVFFVMGHFEKTIEDLSECIRLDPTYFDYFGRSYPYLEIGQWDKAISDCDMAIRMKPNWAGPYPNRARAWLGKKEWEKAHKDYEESIRLAPRDPSMYKYYAFNLATYPDPAFRDGKKAVVMAKKACELTGYSDPYMMETLACAHATAGEFETAVKIQEKVVALKKSAPFQEVLDLFREGKIYIWYPRAWKK